MEDWKQETNEHSHAHFSLQIEVVIEECADNDILWLQVFTVSAADQCMGADTAASDGCVLLQWGPGFPRGPATGGSLWQQG